MPKINGFIARSFSEIDKPKIDPIIEFLGSFQSAGFLIADVEPAEVELVSAKVRDMIDRCQVFVGIFTKRHAIYPTKVGLRTAIDIFRGKFAPSTWSAPPWVLQESGYALKAGKDLILFREEGVEIPGLQGDLEYIPFEPSNTSSAFKKASEMINKLMARASGFSVETIVSPVAKSAETPEAAVGSAEATQKSLEGEGPPDHFEQMMGHISKHEWYGAEQSFQRLIAAIEEKTPEDVALFRSVYYRYCLEAGDPKALDGLKSLVAANPNNAALLVELGECLLEFEQYAEAAECYKTAATLAEPGQAIRYQIRASECMGRDKKLNEAREMLIRLWIGREGAGGEVRFEILSALYGILKQLGDVYTSFAVAELALHESPAQGNFRFSLGLDYNTSGWLELFLRHYVLICEKDKENASALHNLGLAYSKLDLSISSVYRYKQALGLGETLSGSALGYAYLDAGMADDAVDLLRKAQEKDDHASEVDSCLAAVQERRMQESEQGASKLETAKGQQAFLVSFARAFLSEGIPDLDGDWEFPFGTIHLNFEEGKLSGQMLIRKPSYGPFQRAALGIVGREQEQDERVTFAGDVFARTCKYRISKRPEEDLHTDVGKTKKGSLPLALLAGPRGSTEDGYIVFSSDGSSGSVAAVKAGKPEKYYEVKKVR